MVTISLETHVIAKAIIIFFCLSGLAGVPPCGAQSIVGKWKQISAKMFCSPDAVKGSHGHLQEVMDMPKVEAVDEFKSDNTLIETITSGNTKTSNSGKWTISGKTVTISITGHKPMNATISELGNTLIYSMDMPKSEHMQVLRREWTFARI